MPEEVRASVQYGDLRGTIAVDGHEGLSVYDLIKKAKIAPGYFPVGISIYFGTGTGGMEPYASALCVDESILDGKGPEAISRYAKLHGELPVRKFRIKISMPEILEKIKRLDVALQSKFVRDIPMVFSEEETVDNLDDESTI